MKALKFLFLLIPILVLSCCSGINGDNHSNDFKSGPLSKAIVFHRISEPNENAFTFLLPEGWLVSGGITRVNPNSAGGAGNAIEAKLYMKISSGGNEAEMGWLPDTRFFDMRRYPSANLAAPMFPDGSNYNGMLVMKLPTAEDFIWKVAIPFAHPHATGIKIISINPLIELASSYSKLSERMMNGYRFSYQSAIATLEYSENGVLYLEKIVTVIEDFGPVGAGLWGNRETWYVRAGKDRFNQYAPVFATIGHSVRLNPEWIRREIRSQQENSNIALQTRKAVEQIDREITEHRAMTTAEINNEMYLNLTGQEDYTNPFTGETERGTNEWKYRWENEQGDVIYHNNSNYNPNDDDISIKGFKRSEIRKR